MLIDAFSLGFNKLGLVSVLFALVVSDARSAEIPIHFQPNEFEGGQIFLPCAYDGFSSECFFDSGSDSNDVAYNDATKALPALRQSRFRGAGGVEKICDVVKIESWRVGPFEKPNSEAVRCPDSVPSDTLGIGFFSDVSFLLSIDHRKLETAPRPPSESLQPLHVYPKGHVAMEVEILGRPFEAMWDTGAGVSAVDQKLVAEMPEAFQYLQDIPEGADSTGAPVSVKLYSITGLTIGGVSTRDSKVIAIDFSAFSSEFSPRLRLVLGPNHIRQHTWFIDVPSRRWSMGNP